MKLLEMDPKMFDDFLFKVVCLGINFSSLSLRTDASFNSKIY